MVESEKLRSSINYALRITHSELAKQLHTKKDLFTHYDKYEIIMEGDIMINTEKYSWNDERENMINKIMTKAGVTREQAEEALEKNNDDLLDAMIYVERTYGLSSKAAAEKAAAQQAAEQAAAEKAAAQQAAQQAAAQQAAAQQAAAQAAAQQAAAQQAAQQAAAQQAAAQQAAQQAAAQQAAAQQAAAQAAAQQAEQQAREEKSKAFAEKFGKIISVLFSNNVDIYKDGSMVTSVPVGIMVIMMLFSANLLAVLMITSLFFGVSYRFSGPQFGRPNANMVMDSLYNTAQRFKTMIFGK